MAYMKSTVSWSSILSELIVTTSCERPVSVYERRRQWEELFTSIGVMSSSTCLLFSSRTPFRMLISSSRRGSSPCRWNAKNDLAHKRFSVSPY